MAAKLPFGRDRRLRRRADFVRVQGTGRRVTTAHFVLLLSRYVPPARPPTRAPRIPVAGAAVAARTADGNAPASLPPSRLGLVVSRKAGHAVARARIKRLCRECFRTWPAVAGRAFLPPGVDLVVIARAGASELSLAEVQSEWRGVERQIARRSAEALAQPVGEPHVAAIKRR